MRVAEKNLDLLYKYRELNDIEALGELLNINKGLVYKQALKYKYTFKHTLDIDDLVQEGMGGLLKAVDKYDGKQGTSFSTYALYWVRQAIVRGIVDTGLMIRLPNWRIEQLMKLYTYEDKLQKLGKTLCLETLLKDLDLTATCYHELEMIRTSRLAVASIQGLAPMLDEGEDLCYFTALHKLVRADYMTSEGTPEALYLKLEAKEELLRILDTLPARYAEIVKYRYGLGGYSGATLAKTGEFFGISRQRTLQIEQKVLQLLREKLPNNVFDLCG